MIVGVISGIIEKNVKQAYIDRNAYKQIDNKK